MIRKSLLTRFIMHLWTIYISDYDTVLFLTILLYHIDQLW
jgi:hypothetical protein